MIPRSINEIEERKYLDLKLKSSKDFNFEIRLDSKNRVFKFRYFSPEDYCSFFECIGDTIQDLDIYQVSTNLVKLIKAEINTDNSFHWDICINALKSYVWSLNGRVLDQEIDLNNIICRCNSIDKTNLASLALEHRYNKKLVVQNSDISMVCGGCKQQFDDFWNEL